MTISVYDNNTWKIPRAIYVFDGNANVWTETKSVSSGTVGNVWVLHHNTAVISANITNANLFSLMGSPTTPINVKVTINANVFITSNNANIAGMTIGSFPTGSRVYLINNGTITGNTSSPDIRGGNAVSTTTSLILNNNGAIRAGNDSNGANPGYYLSGSSVTTFENAGTLSGLSG
jgi:hypothetical protein